MMKLFSALRHRTFALLWSGQAISHLGDSLYRVALAWWVLEKTGSATAMGTVLVFSMTPMLIFLLLGGVAVDRLPRVRLMLGSDVLRGVVTTLVAALAFANLLQIWHVYLASVVFGFVDAFFQPAYVATVPEITPREALNSANALTNLSRQLTGTVGPAIGAAIVALGGTSTAFALDAASFFISAACLLPIPPLQPARADRPSRNILYDLREGLAAVAANPWLWVTITLAALGNVTSGGPLAVALPFLIKNTLSGDVGLLGLSGSLISLGEVLSSIWLGRIARLRRRGLIAYGGLLASGLAVLLYVLPGGVAGIAAGALLFGTSIAAFGLVWTSTLQEMVPGELLGRVSSIDYLGSFVLLPVGYALAGFTTDRLGAPPVFVIGAIGTLALALLGLAHPAIRHLD
ncbi:MAG TPA: MFS transporter [Kouleothrix sp.]|uniref:MFS transporter n=1 Tax=Kouleothrix sp. TaxID=2779161 RepID=UPI002BC8521D|nr:MFS transporter [Kouleothrix sp.]HRC77081.1 MFS transporter [Kouleothrix sp.]